MFYKTMQIGDGCKILSFVKLKKYESLDFNTSDRIMSEI